MLNYTNSVKDILTNREFRLHQLAKTCGISMSMLVKVLDARDEEAKPTARIVLSDNEQLMLHTFCEYIGTLKGALEYHRSLEKLAAVREAALQAELQAVGEQAQDWYGQNQQDWYEKYQKQRDALHALAAACPEQAQALEATCPALREMAQHQQANSLADACDDTYNEEPVTQSFMEHPEFTVLSVKQALVHLWEEGVEFCQEPSKDEASDLAFGVGRLLGAIFGKKYVSVWGDGQHMAKCQERMNAYGHFRSQRHLPA